MTDENKQTWNHIPPAWVTAAKKGCAMCCGRLRIPPAGPPFQQGPNVGRYLCAACWTLQWSAQPDEMADEETRRFVADEAVRIRNERKSSILFQEGKNRVYVSSRGTLIFDIHSSSELAPNEFDAEGLAFLVKAVAKISEKKQTEPIRAGA